MVDRRTVAQGFRFFGALRRVVRAAILVALSAAPAGPGALAAARAATLPLTASEPIPAAQPALEDAIVRATNAARARHGLAPLAPDEGLARAAREHAAEMAKLEYFSHGSPVPAHDTLTKRLALAGCPMVDVAENIAMLGRHGSVAATAQQVVLDWLNSPPHRKNLLNAHYDRLGIGAAEDPQGRLFLVQDFGADPLQLLRDSVAPTTRTVREVTVVLHASRAARALVQLGSDSPVTQSVAAGTSTVLLTSDASGTVALAVGESLHGNDFVVDDEGRLDLGDGRYQPNPGASGGALRIDAVQVRPRIERGARVTLGYAAPPGTVLALFLQGVYQPAARTGQGDFTLFVPRSLGDASVSIGIQGKGESVAIVHRFHLDAARHPPALQAGAAP